MVRMSDFFKSNGDDDDKPPLPIPTVTVRRNDDDSEWTEEQVRGMTCNPVYAGVPPYPALISEDLWVRVVAKMIREDGPEQFLVNMLYVLRVSMYDAGDE